MHKNEEILDKAISRIKNGEEISTVLLSYPLELRENLSSNLNLIKIGLSLPKKQAPSPIKRKLYLQEQPQSKLANFINSVQIYALAFGVIILVITGTAYGARNSGPGDRLFSLKRAFENAQIKFAATPQKKADLQLIFANARLSEAQKIITENDNIKSTLAVNELNTQTEVALNNIKQVVNSGISKDQGINIIKNVQNLADNQAKLVAKIDPSNAVAIVQSNQKTVADIRKIIVVSNDQAPANFRTDIPIEITGKISSIKNNSVMVEKNTFAIDDQTVVQDKDGKTILLSSLSENDNIKIQGQIKETQNLAQTITLISKAPETKAPEKNKSVKPELLQQSDLLNIAPQQSQVPAPIKPNDTFGNFIPETSNGLPGITIQK